MRLPRNCYLSKGEFFICDQYLDCFEKYTILNRDEHPNQNLDAPIVSVRVSVCVCV